MTEIDTAATAVSQTTPIDCNTVYSSIPLACTTSKQRFSTTMAYLQPLASALAELRPAKFRAAMVWLESVYNQFLSGEWELLVSYPKDLALSILFATDIVTVCRTLCGNFAFFR